MTDEINTENTPIAEIKETDIIEEAKRLKEEIIKENDAVKKNLQELKKFNAEMELRGKSMAGQAVREKTSLENAQDAANLLAKAMGRDPLY
jgi:hypothetical protein